MIYKVFECSPNNSSGSFAPVNRLKNGLLLFRLKNVENVCRREENLFYFLDQVAYSQKFMR